MLYLNHIYILWSCHWNGINSISSIKDQHKVSESQIYKYCNCQPRPLYLAKLSIKMEGDTNFLWSKQIKRIYDTRNWKFKRNKKGRLICGSHLLILCWTEHCWEHGALWTLDSPDPISNTTYHYFWRQFVQSLLFRAKSQVFRPTTIYSQSLPCKLSAIEPLLVRKSHWFVWDAPQATCVTACHGARPWRDCLMPVSISQRFTWIWHIVQTCVVVPKSKINNHVPGSQELSNVSDSLT